MIEYYECEVCGSLLAPRENCPHRKDEAHVAHQTDIKGPRTKRRKATFKRSYALYCTYCGITLCQTCRRNGDGKLCNNAATWDHVIPLSVDTRIAPVEGRGKVPACRWCNGDRADRRIGDWFKSLNRRYEDNQFKRDPVGRDRAERILKAWRSKGQCTIKT